MVYSVRIGCPEFVISFFGIRNEVSVSLPQLGGSAGPVRSATQLSIPFPEKWRLEMAEIHNDE